jgi:membrane protease YdiL (CAAX protease family)
MHIGSLGQSGSDMEPLTFRNPWIVSVTCARRRVPLWAVLAIAGAALICGLIATPALHRLWATLYLPAAPPLALSRTLLEAGVFFPLYACALGMQFWEGRAARRTTGFARWEGLVIGVGIGASASLAAILAASASGVVHPGAGAQAIGFGLLLASLLTAFQAFGEEIFFRGWLQPLLGANIGLKAGLVLTAGVFAGAHLITQSLSVVAIVNIFAAGLLFGLLALRTGGLAAPFGAHAVWNWLEQSVMGLMPNPGSDPLGSFFDFDLVGPPLLSGGEDGLDGSLLVTLVLAVAIAGVALIKPAEAGGEAMAQAAPFRGHPRRK